MAQNNTWQKKDAKYISREWKNGRWQYVYPEDVAKKKQATYQKNVAKTKLTSRVNSALYKAKKGFENATGITAAKKYDAAKANSEYAAKKVDATKKASGNESFGQKAARKTAQISAEKNLWDARTNELKAKAELASTPVGKLRNASEKINNAKAKVADWWGVDEKEAVDAARLELSKATYQQREYGSGNSAGKNANYENQRVAAERNYHNANAAFGKTPLGKLTAVADTGKYWLDKIVGGITDRINDRKEAKAAAEAAEIAEANRQRNETNKAKGTEARARQQERLNIEADVDATVANDKRNAIKDSRNTTRTRQNDRLGIEDSVDSAVASDRRKTTNATRARQTERTGLDDRMADYEDEAKYDTQVKKVSDTRARQNSRTNIEDIGDAATRQAKYESQSKKVSDTRTRQEDRLDIEDSVAEDEERRKRELIKKGAKARARQNVINR